MTEELKKENMEKSSDENTEKKENDKQDEKQDDAKKNDAFLIKLCLMNARLQLMLRSTAEERKKKINLLSTATPVSLKTQL